MSTVIHMNTEQVRSAVERLNQAGQQVVDAIQMLSRQADDIPWQGPSHDEFIIEFITLSKSFVSQAENVLILASRVEREVAKWEDGDSAFGVAATGGMVGAAASLAGLQAENPLAGGSVEGPTTKIPGTFTGNLIPGESAEGPGPVTQAIIPGEIPQAPHTMAVSPSESPEGPGGITETLMPGGETPQAPHTMAVSSSESPEGPGGITETFLAGGEAPHAPLTLAGYNIEQPEQPNYSTMAVGETPEEPKMESIDLDPSKMQSIISENQQNHLNLDDLPKDDPGGK